MQSYFITGTDTGCGKTEITLGLMHQFQRSGRIVQGMKPIAAGATAVPEGLCNEDALRIQRQCSHAVDYAWVNPFAYSPAIAPHLAAQMVNRPIELKVVQQAYRQLGREADIVIVEGVGGWLVPLGQDKTTADLVRTLDLPVILVVGMKLGCINHALLTQESILRAGRVLQGWVGNSIDPDMEAWEGNLMTLSQFIKAPCLGVIPYLQQPTAQAVGDYLQIGQLR